jgi:hypothetical protein
MNLRLQRSQVGRSPRLRTAPDLNERRFVNSSLPPFEMARRDSGAAVDSFLLPGATYPADRRMAAQIAA